MDGDGTSQFYFPGVILIEPFLLAVDTNSSSSQTSPGKNSLLQRDPL